MIGVVVLAVAMTSSVSAAPTEDESDIAPRSGTLSITVPAGPVSIGSGAPGSSISGLLGTVTIQNTTPVLTAWTATVSSTNFTTGGGTTAETIANGSVSYWSGPATSTVGSGTFTPGQLTAANAVPLSTSQTAFSFSGTGNNNVTWDPTLVVAVPAAAVGGTYTGTVTHSVA